MPIERKVSGDFFFKPAPILDFNLLIMLKKGVVILLNFILLNEKTAVKIIKTPTAIDSFCCAANKFNTFPSKPNNNPIMAYDKIRPKL